MAGIEKKEVIILSTDEHILLLDTFKILASILEISECNNADAVYDDVNEAIKSLNNVLRISVLEE